LCAVPLRERGACRGRVRPLLRPREDARLDTARHSGPAHSGTFIVVNGYVDDRLCVVPSATRAGPEVEPVFRCVALQHL
jgi:hypothetical protein